MARWRIKSPASRLFAQPFVQAQIKENTKGPRHWPLWGEFTGDLWIPFTKSKLRGKRFHFMTSWWLLWQGKEVNIYAQSYRYSAYWSHMACNIVVWQDKYGYLKIWSETCQRCRPTYGWILVVHHDKLFPFKFHYSRWLENCQGYPCL